MRLQTPFTGESGYRSAFRLVVVAFLTVAAVAASSGVVDAQRQGEERWGQDNCLYQWSGKRWLRTNTCQVVRSRGVVDVYDTSTGQFTMRLDESDRRFFAIHLLSGPTAGTLIHLYPGGSHAIRDRSGVWILSNADAKRQWTAVFGSGAVGRARRRRDRGESDALTEALGNQAVRSSTFYKNHRYPQ